MNPKELRIGNFYQPTDGSIEFKSITVDDLKAWSLGAIYGKPIPLTEEWLIKLGFNNTAIKWNDGSISDSVWQMKGKYSIEFTTEGVIFYIFLGKDGNPVFINHTNYVHQVQNLYFFMTGIELEVKQIA